MLYTFNEQLITEQASVGAMIIRIIINGFPKSLKL